MNPEPKPDPSADPERLFSQTYDRLRALAAAQLQGNRRGTLQPTMLVHEAFVKFAGANATYADQGHFLAMVANAMRQVVVDHARARGALKRPPGERDRVTISNVVEDSNPAGELDVLDLEEALNDLARESPRPASVAELRLFAGLDVDQVAQALGVSPRTVKYDWRFARAWLRTRLDP